MLETLSGARCCADKLELRFEHRHVGLGALETSIIALPSLTARRPARDAIGQLHAPGDLSTRLPTALRRWGMRGTVTRTVISSETKERESRDAEGAES